MSKTAIVIFSDPASGSEEALGRLLNGLMLTLELKERSEEVALIFQGAGTRWPAQITQPTHAAHMLYDAVRDKVAGICGACADAFGATDGATATGLPMVRERQINGIGGVVDLSRYLADGYRLVTL